MKKVLALILAVMMILPMTFTATAAEAEDDLSVAPSKYTQVKVFTGTYGFGTEEMNVYTNDDFSEFYIYFWSFDSDQVLEGTVEDGICSVDFDYSGFMAGDCQLIWDDAMASDEAWTPVDNTAVTDTAENTEEPEEQTEEAFRNGYPVVEIESNIQVKHIYDADVEKIAAEHPYDEYQNRIVFYGASNFARWESIYDDLADYKVLNSAFGGSTDMDLVYFANDILFPYNPSIVFFQTGSNEYGGLKGNYEERAKTTLEYKRQMFEAFHEIMPDAYFVIMSGLLIPGRAHFAELTQNINEGLAKMAEETDYLYFVDATEMTYDGENFKEELFVEDGLHLTEEGQQIWCQEYIIPAIEQVISEQELDAVRN